MRWKKREGYHYQHVILKEPLKLYVKKTHLSDICEKKEKEKKKKRKKEKKKKFSSYLGGSI